MGGGFSVEANVMVPRGNIGLDEERVCMFDD